MVLGRPVISRAECAGLIEARRLPADGTIRTEISRAECAGLIEALRYASLAVSRIRISRAECAGLIEAGSRSADAPAWSRFPALNARASLKRRWT